MSRRRTNVDAFLFPALGVFSVRVLYVLRQSKRSLTLPKLGVRANEENHRTVHAAVYRLEQAGFVQKEGIEVTVRGKKITAFAITDLGLRALAANESAIEIWLGKKVPTNAKDAVTTYFVRPPKVDDDDDEPQVQPFR